MAKGSPLAGSRSEHLSFDLSVRETDKCGLRSYDQPASKLAT